MESFQLKLDETLLEELKADISAEFLGFVILEAITLMVNDYTGGGGESVIVDDAVYRCDDPNSDYDVSVSHLLNILSDGAKVNGVLNEGEFYEFNSQYHEMVCERLNMAMLALRDNNCITYLASIALMMNETQYAAGYLFDITLIDNIAMFNVSSVLYT